MLVSGEKKTLVHCWRECKLVQSLENWRFLKTLKIELTPGCISKENKTLI